MPKAPVTRVDAVLFDVGETIINENEIYAGWADWFGVPRHTFISRLGAFIAEGRPLIELFEYFQPGFDLAETKKLRIQAGQAVGFGPADLYPDARGCLSGLRAQGLFVGLAGNQPVEAADRLAAMDLDVDLIGISDIWGVTKPDPAFFERCVRESGVPAERILYVGDRIDNDVRPGLAAGLQLAFLRRGPWGHIQQGFPQSREPLSRCLFRLDDLAGLPDLVARHNLDP